MLRLREIMTTDVVTVDPATTLRDAIELFTARHIGGAPVVDGGRVVGVVSASDVLDFEATTRAAPSAGEGPSEPDERREPPDLDWDDEPAMRFFVDLWSDGGADAVARFDAPESPEWDVLAEHTVDEIMTREVYSLAPTSDVSTAADRMRTYGVHRVLVMDGERLLGIVTTMDLARAVADRRIVRRTYVFDRSRVERGRDRGAF